MLFIRIFFYGVVKQAGVGDLVINEQFAVDGTLIEAWACMKNFRPKGESPFHRPGNADRDNQATGFRGEKSRTPRTNHHTRDH